MRTSTSKLTALVASLASVPAATAAGKLGFALGVKQPSGACKVQGDYEADFDAISRDSSSKIVRIYDANECDVTAQMLPAAANKGFQAILGIWYELPSTWGEVGKTNLIGPKRTISIMAANKPS